MSKKNQVVRVEGREAWHKLRDKMIRIPLEMSFIEAQNLIQYEADKQCVNLATIGKIIIRRNGTIDFFIKNKLKGGAGNER